MSKDNENKNNDLENANRRLNSLYKKLFEPKAKKIDLKLDGLNKIGDALGKISSKMSPTTSSNGPAVSTKAINFILKKQSPTSPVHPGFGFDEKKFNQSLKANLINKKDFKKILKEIDRAIPDEYKNSSVTLIYKDAQDSDRENKSANLQLIIRDKNLANQILQHVSNDNVSEEDIRKALQSSSENDVTDDFDLTEKDELSFDDEMTIADDPGSAKAIKFNMVDAEQGAGDKTLEGVGLLQSTDPYEYVVEFKVADLLSCPLDKVWNLTYIPYEATNSEQIDKKIQMLKADTPGSKVSDLFLEICQNGSGRQLDNFINSAYFQQLQANDDDFVMSRQAKLLILFDRTDNLNRNAFHVAAHYGNDSVLAGLIQNHHSFLSIDSTTLINAPDLLGFNALDYAIQNKSQNMQQLLGDLNAQPLFNANNNATNFLNLNLEDPVEKNRQDASYNSSSIIENEAKYNIDSNFSTGVEREQNNTLDDPAAPKAAQEKNSNIHHRYQQALKDIFNLKKSTTGSKSPKSNEVEEKDPNKRFRI